MAELICMQPEQFPSSNGPFETQYGIDAMMSMQQVSPENYRHTFIYFGIWQGLLFFLQSWDFFDTSFHISRGCGVRFNVDTYLQRFCAP